MRRPTIDQNVSPNLVPMIDIMFLLLLFFMLSADMTQRELEDVELPKAESAKPDELGGAITVNVSHARDVACSARPACRIPDHWRLGIGGRDFTDPERLAALLKERGPESRVQIRADASAPYALPQRAMDACARAGITRVEVGAAMSEK